MVGADWLILHDVDVIRELRANSTSLLQPTSSWDRGWVVQMAPTNMITPFACSASGFLFFLVLFVETEAAE